jgi:iron only hydrogenase large subunit-like protein/nitrogen-specific signal transduction histidine kinase
VKPVMKNTIASTCKRCYSCVRACPSKAISVQDGTARIDLKRCVHCGECIRRCPAGQWEYERHQALVRGLLNAESRVAIVLDTAFPAAFPDIDHKFLATKLRHLGFDIVTDASFGADIVAHIHKKTHADPRKSVLLSSWCPACVDMVRKFAPEHLDLLSGLLPPMTAMARILRTMHGDELQVVYASPCIAHKALAKNKHIPSGIDAVLTFHELIEMLAGIDNFEPSRYHNGFDPPHGNTGLYSALPLGVSMTAGYPCDPLDTIVTDGSGPRRILRILDAITAGEITHGFIDLLFCRGCVDGCAMPVLAGSRYKRRNTVLKHAKQMTDSFDADSWKSLMNTCLNLDLKEAVKPMLLRKATPETSVLQSIRKELDEYGDHQIVDCYACGYPTCGEFIVAVGKGLAETDMCIQYQLRKLQSAIRNLQESHERMNSMLDVMHHSEKLANLAQLSAATAYKLNNPLSIVLLYSHLLKEEYKDHPELEKDLTIIVDQVERVKDIFITLLNLSSKNKILLESVDVRELIDRTLMLLQPSDSVKVNVTCDAETAVAEMDREQIGYVLTNIVENALEAMVNGGALTVHTTGDDENMIIRIYDNGPGIRKNTLKKIWDPFFTTKRVSIGAGLGLAVAREIIRQHQGSITVVSNDNASRGPTGTTFTITIPRHGIEGTIGGF